MKHFEDEQMLWESKNKHLMLTTHRLRQTHKNVFGGKIKSIMLEELTSCELRTIRQFGFIKKAVLYFVLINVTVYLLNNFLFNAELIKIFFNDFHIGAHTAQIIFYISVAVAFAYLTLYFLSVKKVITFYATSMTIDFQLRWLDFAERESFISKVEEAKSKRQQQLFNPH